jgi:hypothetical protein
MAKRDGARGAETIEELKQVIAHYQAEFEELAEEVKGMAPGVFDEFARFRDSMERQDRSAEAYEAILAMLSPGPERG